MLETEKKKSINISPQISSVETSSEYITGVWATKKAHLLGNECCVIQFCQLTLVLLLIRAW